MKPLICKQCGGQIDPRTYICNACGTAYEKPQAPVHMIKAVHEDPRFVTLSARVDISEAYYYRGDPTEIARMAIDDLTHQLAETIMPFIEMRVGMFDPLTFGQSLQATIRVKKPEGSTVADGRWFDELHIRR